MTPLHFIIATAAVGIIAILYVDASLTKAVDDALDGDADWLDPTLPGDLKVPVHPVGVDHV